MFSNCEERQERCEAKILREVRGTGVCRCSENNRKLLIVVWLLICLLIDTVSGSSDPVKVFQNPERRITTMCIKNLTASQGHDYIFQCDLYFLIIISNVHHKQMFINCALKKGRWNDHSTCLRIITSFLQYQSDPVTVVCTLLSKLQTGTVNS